MQKTSVQSGMTDGVDTTVVLVEDGSLIPINRHHKITTKAVENTPRLFYIWCRRPDTVVPPSIPGTSCYKGPLAWCRALECTVLVLILVLFFCNGILTGSLVLNDLMGWETNRHFSLGLIFFNMYTVYSLLLRKLAIIDK